MTPTTNSIVGLTAHEQCTWYHFQFKGTLGVHCFMPGPLRNVVICAIAIVCVTRMTVFVRALETSSSPAVGTTDITFDRAIDGGVAHRLNPRTQGWTVVNHGNGTTYSVILVASKRGNSSLCRDKRRVRNFNDGVVSVQFASPNPSTKFVAGRGHSPFNTSHPQGVNVRVTIVYEADLVAPGGSLDAVQVSHLKAVCEDPHERTVFVMSDETCERLAIPTGVPASCWSNLARHYPYNAPSPKVETRYAYLPLGPKYPFPFIEPDRNRRASRRPLLFNLQVSQRTSRRRKELVDIVHTYHVNHPDVMCHENGEGIDEEQWQTLLSQSQFTLTPGGHNPETFRMFEALEAGSIPIVSKKDYMDPSVRAPHPCGIGNAAWNTVAASPFAKMASVDTWEDLPELLDRLARETPDAIDKLQAQCTEWYTTLMTRTYGSLLNFGQGQDMWPQAGPILGEI